MSSEHYVRMTAEPPWTTENALGVIERGKSEAVRRNVHRVLFDLRQWEQPTTEMVRFDSGVHLAKLLASPYRVAALGKKEHVNYFAENVAVNRGANVKVFADETLALAWLLA